MIFTYIIFNNKSISFVLKADPSLPGGPLSTNSVHLAASRPTSTVSTDNFLNQKPKLAFGMEKFTFTFGTIPSPTHKYILIW